MFHKMRNKMLRSKSGQVSVIILLIVAIAFIVYGMVLNIGDLSTNKMLTDIAATSGAASLASQMASQGQQLLMQQLGGDFKVCESTGILGKLFAFVLLVAIAFFLFRVCCYWFCKRTCNYGSCFIRNKFGFESSCDSANDYQSLG